MTRLYLDQCCDGLNFLSTKGTLYGQYTQYSLDSHQNDRPTSCSPNHQTSAQTLYPPSRCKCMCYRAEPHYPSYTSE
uniref:Uncharacterized protein n=1 Tax=Anguilla anguilla TaxID=7936 RepID=A0A0E9XNT4_ANGAN